MNLDGSETKSLRSHLSSTAPFQRGSHTGRNDAVSKSLVVNSFKGISDNESRNHTKHLFDSIQIDEMIAASQKYSHRLKRPIVPKLEVPTAWAQSKDKKKRDYIS